MWILILLGILSSVFNGDCRPNGAPAKSCFYMTPRHIHPHTMRKVFPTAHNGLYNITTSSDIFRPDKPIRVTLWGPPFKGFLIAAAEEGAKDWPTGVFFSDDGSANRMNCLGHGDTATHVNNSYKDSVSFLWYGPDSMSVEQVQFIATVVVNVSMYYTNIRSNWIRVDPSLPAKGTGDATGVTADPWLLGNEQPDPWGTGQGGSSWSGGGTGSSWGGSTGTSSWGSGGNQWGSNTGSNQWGSNTGSGSQWSGSSGTGSWGSGGTGTNQWGGSSSGSGNQWDSWGNQGQGTGSGSTWNWNNQGQSAAGKSTTGTGQWGGPGSGSNWNWGQTTTASWGSKTSAWERTTAAQPSATQASAADTAQQTGTAAQDGTGAQGGTGGTQTGGTTVTDTKQSSIDWIKNIPTQTWYEILRRLGFNVDSTSSATTGAKKSATSGTTV